MVRNVTGGKKMYLCEHCMFAYTDIETARKCEKFCETHRGCSMEITKHAVGIFDSGKFIRFKNKL